MQLLDTLERCARILSNSKDVKLNQEAIKNFALGIQHAELIKGISTAKPLAMAKNDRLKKASLFLAYNVMNFSYYPKKGKKRWWIRQGEEDIGKDDEAHAFVTCLTQAQLAGADWEDVNFLRKTTEDSLAKIFVPADGAGNLPLLKVRARCLRSLGVGYEKLLAETDDAKASPVDLLLKKAGGNALNFVELLTTYVPAFSDTRSYKLDSGEVVEIAFHKRAQLCTSMIHGDGVEDLSQDLDKLTIFADYKIPQLFREFGIMEYSTDLQRRIDELIDIKEGSSAEVEIRAATVLGSEYVRQELWKRGTEFQLPSAKLDYYLWRKAVELTEENPNIPPFHRTRGTCY